MVEKSFESADPSADIWPILCSRDLRCCLAGAVSGIVSRTCTAPIDRLKVMRQVYGYKHKHSNFIQTYRYMLQEGGIFSLWRGNGLNSFKIAPETAIKYNSYEHYKQYLAEKCPDLFLSHPSLVNFVSAAMAGFTSQTAIYPVEVLRTRMCLRKTGQYSSIVDCGRQIYSELGVLGFFRGYGINFLGALPYSGLELASYEWLRQAFLSSKMQPALCSTPDHQHNMMHPPAYIIPLLAATASALAIVTTYPLALIRAKLQAAVYWSPPGHETRSRLRVPALLVAIFRDDGLVGFYRGLGANLIKVLPASAITLFTYETIRRKMDLGPLGSG